MSNQNVEAQSQSNEVSLFDTTIARVQSAENLEQVQKVLDDLFNGIIVMSNDKSLKVFDAAKVRLKELKTLNKSTKSKKQ